LSDQVPGKTITAKFMRGVSIALRALLWRWRVEYWHEHGRGIVALVIGVW
jgi:hypothetical protein